MKKEFLSIKEKQDNKIYKFNYIKHILIVNELPYIKIKLNNK